MAESMDFSKTQRIILLIDLNPILHLRNPNPYLTSILTASKILLSFTSLSSSLFAFKLFFSSLSPIRSSSTLHTLSTSVSFDRPSETFNSLSKTLSSLSASSFPTLKEAPLLSQASNISNSLLQLTHDYAWESQIENLSGKTDNFPVITSNLVVLFSPICRSLKCLAEIFNVDLSDESLRNLDLFCVKFCKQFGIVNDRFAGREIHTCWVDVNYEKESSKENDEINESILQLGLVENGIRSLGWGFCSTDSIILGSALVPFGLIYPKIWFSTLNDNDLNNKRIQGQLSLEVSDVSGKPLECKCCDLELLSLRVRSVNMKDPLEFRNSRDESFDQDQTILGQFDDGIVKLHVKTVRRYSRGVKITEQSRDQILVREISEESGKNRKKCFDEFFANRVLEQLSRETGELIQRNSTPIWQILMSFLYKEDCWALVSILKGNGVSCMGFLKPFTAHLALLSIIDNELIVPDNVNVSDVSKIDEIPSKVGIVTNNCKRSIDSKIGISSSGKEKKCKKHSLQYLTWSTFYKAAFECSNFDLAELYFARDSANSKKLKFLKCWMRQIKRSSCSHHIRQCKSELNHHIAKEIDERLTSVHNESEQPISRELSLEPSRMEEGNALVSYVETAEGFFCNLHKKIKDGLKAKGVDLQILAQRLVKSSIHWLHWKQEKGYDRESPTSTSSRPCDRTVGIELIELLTKDPKELKKPNDNRTPLQASDQDSSSEYIVREYELQILLRMEILQSEVADTIQEFTKRKLVKQICSLLDIIQYIVEGGVHGHVSLFDYAERSIKNRYCRTLEDVVQIIYTEMDLLPFGEEDESQLLLLNSEDSNQSWRNKQERDDTAVTKNIDQSVSAEDESSQPLENFDETPHGIEREESARQLREARERRERARRFVSFTSMVPDLQRVWAPKQSKAGNLKSHSLSKESKGKDKQMESYTVVCETPMTGWKHSCSRESRKGDKEVQDNGSNSSGSVSKALFQDDR